MKKFRTRKDIFIFRGATPTGVGRFTESSSIHDSEPVIHRQHNVALAGQILIHGIRIVVVVHVVKAQ